MLRINFGYDRNLMIPRALQSKERKEIFTFDARGDTNISKL